MTVQELIEREVGKDGNLAAWARKIEVSYKTVQRWRNVGGAPDPRSVEKIAAAHDGLRVRSTRDASSASTPALVAQLAEVVDRLDKVVARLEGLDGQPDTQAASKPASARPRRP